MLGILFLTIVSMNIVWIWYMWETWNYGWIKNSVCTCTRSETMITYLLYQQRELKELKETFNGRKWVEVYFCK